MSGSIEATYKEHRNAFGVIIPHRQAILMNPRWVEYIRLTFTDFIAALGVPRERRAALVEDLLGAARRHHDEDWYEDTGHRMLRSAVSDEEWKRALEQRVTRIFNQIRPHLRPGTTLDYGCGSGNVGRLIQEFQGGVTLADTYRHPDIDRIGLPFFPLEQHGPAPLRSDAFDNVVLCTVLHHCDFPLVSLAEAIRITKPGGLIIITESVYGVEEDLLLKAPPNPIVDAFASLDEEGQLAVNVFFDHVHNRCLYYSADPETKVNVPYNYKSPTAWNETFLAHGLDTLSTIPLGVDQPLAPLFHTLHVTKKR